MRACYIISLKTLESLKNVRSNSLLCFYAIYVSFFIKISKTIIKWKGERPYVMCVIFNSRVFCRLKLYLYSCFHYHGNLMTEIRQIIYEREVFTGFWTFYIYIYIYVGGV